MRWKEEEAPVNELNGPYFPDGWGDLSVVQFEEDVAAITAWPPPSLKVGGTRLAMRPMF